MIWYMSIDSNNRPNGWREEPEEGYVPVSETERQIHELHPGYIWNGATLVSPPVPAPYIPTADEIKAELVAAVQRHLDATAQTRDYDGILSACSYDNDPNPIFAQDCVAFKAWRSAVWTYCFQVLADCTNGLRSIPTTSELIAELPEVNLG